MKKLIMLVLIIVTIAAVYYGIKTHLYTEGEIINDDFEVKGDIRNLDIDAAMLDVRIEDGDEIKVQYKGDERFRPTWKYDEASGTLSIKQPKSVKTGNFNKESRLTIEIPKEHQMDSFTVNLDMGNLKIEELLAKDISLEDNMGNIEIEKSVSDKIKVEANMGNVVIRKCDTTDVTVNAAMGNVEIKLEEDIEDYTIKAETSLGNLTIGKEHHTGSFDQTGTKGTIKVNCSLGDVEIR